MKCDEKRPRCKRCRHANRDCVFLTPQDLSPPPSTPLATALPETHIRRSWIRPSSAGRHAVSLRTRPHDCLTGQRLTHRVIAVVLSISREREPSHPQLEPRTARACPFPVEVEPPLPKSRRAHATTELDSSPTDVSPEHRHNLPSTRTNSWSSQTLFEAGHQISRRPGSASSLNIPQHIDRVGSFNQRPISDVQIYRLLQYYVDVVGPWVSAMFYLVYNHQSHIAAGHKC